MTGHYWFETVFLGSPEDRPYHRAAEASRQRQLIAYMLSLPDGVDRR
jgi:hypothetical protein